MDLGNLFGNTTSNLEESVENLQKVANFFSLENLHRLIIYAILIVVLIIIIKIVIGYFTDKAKAKMIAKEVIKELEANGYPTKKNVHPSIEE